MVKPITLKSKMNSTPESPPESEQGLSGVPFSPSRYPLTAFIPASIPASQLPCEKALFIYLSKHPIKYTIKKRLYLLSS